MSNLPPDWREPQHDEFTEEELEEALRAELLHDQVEGSLAENIMANTDLVAAFITEWHDFITPRIQEQRIEAAYRRAFNGEHIDGTEE